MSSQYDVHADVVIQTLIAEAAADPDVVGLVLTGSRSVGMVTPESDYDAMFVMRDAAFARHNQAQRVDHLLYALFALERHWRPYSSRLALHLPKLDGQGWQPGELEEIVLALISTGDPQRQQIIARRVVAPLRERGYAHVYDAWEGGCLVGAGAARSGGVYTVGLCCALGGIDKSIAHGAVQAMPGRMQSRTGRQDDSFKNPCYT